MAVVSSCREPIATWGPQGPSKSRLISVEPRFLLRDRGDTEGSRAELEPTPHELAIVIGCVLGDGYLYPSGRLQIEHSVAESAYVEWKYRKLGRLISGSIAEVFRFDSRTGRIYRSRRLHEGNFQIPAEGLLSAREKACAGRG